MSTPDKREEEISNEAEMLMAMHDAQMSAASPSKALYYRMHKEMSASLVRIINEAFEENQDRDALVDQTQNIVAAYAQFVASSISAIALLLGGSSDDRLEHRQTIAKIVISLTNDYLEKFLETEEKEIKSGNGGKWRTP